MSSLQAPASGVYRRHRPETTALYEVVRDNLETLYGAIGDGALAVRIPKHARKELEAYFDCGLLCRGFARLKCQDCGEGRLVSFSCKGRGFCPSCTGRRMNATAANLMERVLPPESGLRQWVLTFPFSWRRRAACLANRSCFTYPLGEIVRFGYDDGYFETYPAKVRGLSVEEVALATKVLDPDRLIWVVVGDRSKIEAGIRELNLGELRVVDADGKVL